MKFDCFQTLAVTLTSWAAAPARTLALTLPSCQPQTQQSPHSSGPCIHTRQPELFPTGAPPACRRLSWSRQGMTACKPASHRTAVTQTPDDFRHGCGHGCFDGCWNLGMVADDNLDGLRLRLRLMVISRRQATIHHSPFTIYQLDMLVRARGANYPCCATCWKYL